MLSPPRVRGAWLLCTAAMLSLPSTSAGRQLSAIPAAFVEVGLGARGGAMGNTGVAGPGVSAVSRNPAAAVHLERIEASFVYLDQFGLVPYTEATVGFPMGSAWGGALLARDSGDDALRETTIRGVLARRAGRFSVGIGAAFLLGRFGRNDLTQADYSVFDPVEVSEGIANQVAGDAAGFTADLGLQYHAGGVTAGVVVRHLVGLVQWNSATAVSGRTYTESIPLEVVTGIEIPAGARGRVAVDYQPALDPETDHVVRAGLEWTPVGLLALRVGTERTANGRPDERYGFGFGLSPPPMAGLRVGASYAYLTGFLGATQQFSIHIGLP